MSLSPAAPTNAPSPWIVKPGWDLSLVLLTPLLLIPVVWGWRARSGEQAIYEAVMAFGALGHHLPGMLRAYGDRELFQRFRTRFLLAPLFLALVCAGFQVAGLHGLAVVALGWGIWHGWMQTFGFARIYDAKRASFRPLTARADFGLCAAWFVGAVVLSPQRSLQVLQALSKAGIGLPAPATVDLLRSVAWVAITSATAFYLFATWRAHRAGVAPALLKHLLLASTISLWWISTHLVPSLIFGLALFEIFHDVQYLAIVWAFNRRRLAQGARSGALSGFLFRGGALGTGLYVGLVFAYGALGPLAERVGEHTLRQSLAGVLLASQLLHFYFDGFIWKVREGSTRAALGVSDTQASGARGRRGLAHLALWLLFVLPVLGMGWREAVLAAPPSAAAASVAAALPASAEAQTSWGLALVNEDRIADALPALRRAYELEPENELRRSDLARNLALAADLALAAADSATARAHLSEARHIEPQLPQLLELLANARAANGEAEAALRVLQALELIAPGPRWPLARVELLLHLGQTERAWRELRAVRSRYPADPTAIEFERRMQAPSPRR